MSKGK